MALIQKIIGTILGLTIATTTSMILKAPVYVQPVFDKWDVVLDKLSWCESRQVADVIIVDSNGYNSYGFLQFQRRTFDYFGDKYGLPHDDILSPAQQYPIARAMFEDGLGPLHWVNCWRMMKLPI